MNRLKLLITVLGLVMASNASAQRGGAKNVFGIKQNTNYGTQKSTERTNCTDFSGVFVGKCSTESEDRTIYINQYACDSIVVDNDFYLIGSVVSNSFFDGGAAVVSSESLNWDESGEKLELSHLSHLKISQNKAIPFSYFSQMSLQGSTLAIKGQIGEEKIYCEYVRN